MCARIARFEGLTNIDEQANEIKRQMAAAKDGDLPEGSPAGVRTLMETVTRFVQLVDREKGTGVRIAFCTTEEDVRRADTALNGMSPDQDQGRRTGSAEIYEVVLDESFG